MKHCTRCKETKPMSEFYNNKRRSDKHSVWCKGCSRKAAREYRKRDGVQTRRNIYNKQATYKNKARAIQMFGDRCLDCDGQFPSNLYSFHHLKPETKEYAISDLLARKWSNRTDIELAKCIMLCSTCHKARHQISITRSE